MNTINALKMHQNKSFKNADTLKEPIISTGSTVAVQCDDGSQWTQDTIIEHGDANHSGQLYII